MKTFVYLFVFTLIFAARPVFSQESTSASFKILDPVIVPSGYSTSASFRLWSTISEVAIGTSTSASYGINSGSLFFPFASTPTVSATAGNGQAALSWTASDGFLGWTPSSYDVGLGTASGGPYTYTDVGNVLSSTRTGLSNGTTYYFVIVVEDAFGNFIATSTEVSATPASSGSGTGGGSGSGGGGGSYITGAIFFGRAYPKTTVTLLKDAQIAATTVADAQANFQIILSNLTAGNYIFSLYSEDKNGNRSSLLTFPVGITLGVTANVRGIFLAPTIATDKSEVRRGDNIAIFGQSAPNSEITISVNSEEEFFVKKIADATGAYLLNFDTSALDMGQHQTKSKAALSGEITAFGKVVSFTVGTKNVSAALSTSIKKGDLNKDGRVNLVDFSIAAYWYKRPISAEFAVKEKEQLNGDGKVDLVDFSIMAYYWTG